MLGQSLDLAELAPELGGRLHERALGGKVLHCLPGSSRPPRVLRERCLAMLGADLQSLLGSRIPADHSGTVLADTYAAAWLARPDRPSAPDVLDLGCGTGDSVDLFRSLEPRVSWTGADIDESPEVAERTRSGRPFRHLRRRAPAVRRRELRPRLLQAGARARAPARAAAGGGIARPAAGRHARRLDLPPRGLPLAQRLELHALRADAAARGGRAGARRGQARDRRLHARRLARVWDASLLLPLVGARVASLPRDLARRPGGALGSPHGEHGQADAERAVRVPGASPGAPRNRIGPCSAPHWSRSLCSPFPRRRRRRRSPPPAAAARSRRTR